MIPGDIIRASLASRKPQAPLAPKSYQTFMPSTLGIQPRENDLTKVLMDKVGSWGETATEQAQIEAANKHNYEIMQQQQQRLDSLQGQIHDVKQSAPGVVPLRPGGNPLPPDIRNMAAKLTGFNKLWAPLGRVDYQVNTPYGWRIHPITGQRSFHTGVDLQASMGDPIYAISNGFIRGANHGDPAYGNQLILGLGHGRQAMFGHLSRFANGISVGDRVHRGQIIGYVGSTGLSTGPHLHFELWRRMHPIDPSQFYRRF